jgi:hypothetical protein
MASIKLLADHFDICGVCIYYDPEKEKKGRYQDSRMLPKKVKLHIISAPFVGIIKQLLQLLQEV